MIDENWKALTCNSMNDNHNWDWRWSIWWFVIPSSLLTPRDCLSVSYPFQLICFPAVVSNCFKKVFVGKPQTICMKLTLMWNKSLHVRSAAAHDLSQLTIWMLLELTNYLEEDQRDAEMSVLLNNRMCSFTSWCIKIFYSHSKDWTSEEYLVYHSTWLLKEIIFSHN